VVPPGLDIIVDTGPIAIIEPVSFVRTYVETDTGFAELVGRITDQGPVTRVELLGVQEEPLSLGGLITFDLQFSVPRACAFEAVSSSSDPLIDPVFEGITGVIDASSGTLSAGTYRLSGEVWGDSVPVALYLLDWRLELAESFYVLPGPDDCPGDLDGNGVVNFFDLVSYLNAFAGNDGVADLVAPCGDWTFFDLDAFLQTADFDCFE
jgi:hypothetical protein